MMRKSRAVNNVIDLTLETVSFPSTPDEKFRVTLKDIPSGETQVWIENKGNKHQWEATIGSMKEHGPDGIPRPAVLRCLKKALESAALLDPPKNDETEPETDLQRADDGEGFVLYLTFSVSGVWNPEYLFLLTPVDLEKIDILEAQVRDAREDIIVLKQEMEKKSDVNERMMSISSTTTASNGVITWDGPTPRIISDIFTLSADNQTVTVTQAGIYQVHVRMGQTNQSNGQFLTLRVNTASFAQCLQSDANNHQNTAQITEILPLNAGDRLDIYTYASSSTLGNPLFNRFWILKL